IDINSGEVRDESSDFNAGGNNWQAYVNPVWYVTGSSNCSADVLEFMLNKGCTPSRAFAVSEANGEKKDFGVDDLIDAVKKSKTNKADRKEYNRIVKLLKDAKDKQKPAAPAVAKAQEPAAPTQPQKPAPEVTAPAAVQQPKQPPVKQTKKTVDKPKQQKQPKELKTEPVKQTSAILTPDEATELLRKSVTDKNKENFYRSLTMGADINSVDKDNKTPLLLAVMSQSYEMVEVLIYKGADLNVRSKGGNTPLSMAKDLGSEDMVKLLQKAGATN
ncbi:MAG: ankyrin repeat domain-containing protein, partial [Spirochaetia bacterium]|nr:ankyrin repeat domain-containing protein [Spirochaetia bacterium]